MASTFLKNLLFTLLLLVTAAAVPAAAEGQEVVVEMMTPNETGAPVTRDHKYRSMVTLYIEHEDKSRTPSGWSTRVSDGASADSPFEFQPGVNLIQGWTDGVLQMKEGERALIHIPASLGYGPRPMGRPGGAFFIPGGSDLLFDIEILGKVTDSEL